MGRKNRLAACLMGFAMRSDPPTQSCLSQPQSRYPAISHISIIATSIPSFIPVTFFVHTAAVDHAWLLPEHWPEACAFNPFLVLPPTPRILIRYFPLKFS